MPALTVLIIGATGSIGRPVVDQALCQGHRVRALVRDVDRARRTLPKEVELLAGDLTRPETLTAAVQGVDAVVLTVNADGGGKDASEAIYYTGLRDLLTVIGPRRTRIALMTAIGVTVCETSYQRSSESHDWKRRAERLLRASGQDYTIIRPCWFDYNATEMQKLLLLQGDTRRSGTPSDGAVGRKQIARVLIESLTCPAANRKSFELITERGPEQTDLTPLFAALNPDRPGGLDGVRDIDNQPLAQEPDRVRADLAELRARIAAT